VTELGNGIPVLVTGATGFLGGHLARELSRRGCRVRALTRRTSGLSALTEQGIEVAHGDLLEEGSLDAAAAGQQVVFHTAGRVSDWGARDLFERANVEGTRNLVTACREAGVARLVHVSSLTVLGLPRDGRVVDETTPCAKLPRGDFYSASKLAGERLVREAHGQGGLATTVVRPGAIWGPGDPNVLPRIIAVLRRGVMPYIDGGSNLLGLSHVANLIPGIIRAGEAKVAAGRLYHLTDDEEITSREALDALADALGLKRPRLSLPYWAVYGIAAIVEGAGRHSGRAAPPAMSRYGVRFVACNCRYNIGRAQRELGYRPMVSFRQGVAALAQERSLESSAPAAPGRAGMPDA